MDSEESRIRYEVEIGQKGEQLFKHMFPYAQISHLSAQKEGCIRLEVKIPDDMQEKFENSFRRKFTEALCDRLPATA